MSFLSSSFNPLATSSATSHTDFRPAALSYFTIFCPALTPPKSKNDEDDIPDNDTTREAAQILFYTSRARAAPKDRMLRQIGVAKGMVEFCSMVSSVPSSSSREDKSWNVHSSKRRMVLVQVEEGIWVHASIDLPQTVRRDSVSGKASKEYHDSLLADEWIEESIHRAWKDWLLLNGSPGYILARKQGRISLERSLEKYFSVWAWSWDLEFASSSGQMEEDADGAGRRSVLEECVDGFPMVPRAPRSKLAQLMQSDAVKQLRDNSRRELVILSDTFVLWPPSNAGCLDSEEEDTNESSEIEDTRSPVALFDQQTRAVLLRRVISHLSGLEKEKDLVRATAVATLSEARRRGTSGAIRNRSTATSNTKNKRDLRTGLGISNNRVASTPVPQQRSASASSTASSTLNDTAKWSNWSGVFGGFGKLAFRGGDSPDRSSTPTVDEEIVASPILAQEEATNTREMSTTLKPDLPIVVAPAKGSAASNEVAGPFQLIQQRLSEAVPLQETGSKMWSGAETAFKGLGASLGLAGSSPSDERTTVAKPTSSAPAEEATDFDRFADASIDTSQISADPDASTVTKVSILEPQVDINELSAALSNDAVDDDFSIDRSDARENLLEVLPEVVEPIALPTQGAAKLANSAKHIDDGNSSLDSASIRTASSTKAFPPISVTSAAWYHAKVLRNEVAGSETSSSPRLAPSEEHSSKRQSITETRRTGVGNESQTDMETADTSISVLSLQSEHHDFELDGWGPERPVPFQTFKCHMGEDLEPLCYEGTATSASSTSSTYHKVSFTTRRLLTLVLIEKEGKNIADHDSETLLDGAWQLLRRLQRILKDYERASGARTVEEEMSVRFLHLDGATQTYQSTLDTVKPKLDRDVLSVAEAHCLSAMAVMKRLNILETFSRSGSGKTWTASRQSLDQRLGANNTEAHGASRCADQTFMVQTGKNISIVDCDNELRRLANVYPSFGI